MLIISGVAYCKKRGLCSAMAVYLGYLGIPLLHREGGYVTKETIHVMVIFRDELSSSGLVG